MGHISDAKLTNNNSIKRALSIKTIQEAHLMAVHIKPFQKKQSSHKIFHSQSAILYFIGELTTEIYSYEEKNTLSSEPTAYTATSRSIFNTSITTASNISFTSPSPTHPWFFVISERIPRTDMLSNRGEPKLHRSR